MRRPKSNKVCPIVGVKLHSQSKEEIPVIIRYKNNFSDEIANQVSNMSSKIKYNLPVINGLACNMSLTAINELSKDPNVEYISFDSKVFALLDIATTSIHTNIPYDQGYTGEGITIAVIDSGVSPHYDLTKPTNRIVGFKDFVNGRTSAYDDNGHGTHVSGIIAGNGYSSRGKYAGAAPKANILGVKVLDNAGSGSTSDVISGIQWVIDTKDRYNTKVLNLSLGSPADDPYYSDPIVKAVDSAIKAGITVVVAAGNSGPSDNTILSPGNSPDVITVGAVDDNKTVELNDDTVASFSSRGPTNEGIRKPDLVAPGVDIMSLSNVNPSDYLSLSGTSMATPLVAGSVALLYNKYPNIDPKTVKTKLKQSCVKIRGSANSEGAGILELESLFQNQSSEVPEQVNSHENFLWNDTFIIIILVLLILFLDF